MSYVVKVSTEVDIEATGDNLILQNIANILRTLKKEVPLNREFGIDSSFIDKPINKIKAKLMKEILTQIEEFEDSVTIKTITFDSDINGIYPVVEVEINE